MTAAPQPGKAHLWWYPHPFAVGPEAEQGAKRDPEVDRDHVLDLRRQAERVIAESENRVLNQQAEAVEDEERRSLARRAGSLTMPEAPVPVAEERDDRRHD